MFLFHIKSPQCVCDINCHTGCTYVRKTVKARQLVSAPERKISRKIQPNTNATSHANKVSSVISGKRVSIMAYPDLEPGNEFRNRVWVPVAAPALKIHQVLARS